MKSETDVCIFGAGISGLSCAYLLAKGGLDVVVLEKEAALGGLCRTIDREGFRFDLGGHRFFTKDPAVNRFFQLILQEDMLWVNRKSRIYYRGKYFPYPLQFLDTLRSVGPWMAVMIVASYLQAQAENRILQRPIASVEDWLISKFGHTLYQLFFKAYTEKVWGISCNQICQDWACQRIRELSLLEAVTNIFFKRRNSNLATLIDKFMYPRLGIGQLCGNLAASIGNERVWTDSELTEIRLCDDQMVEAKFTRSAEAQTIRARHFVSSIPLPHLVRLLVPAPPQEVLQAAAQLRYRGLILINLTVNKESISDDTWLYIQDPKVQMSRVHEPRNWSRAMSPPGMTSLCVEYPCYEGDELWQTPNEQLVELAVQELCTMLGLLHREEIMAGSVVRVPHAYPVYHVGYRQPRSMVRDFLHSIPNLQIIGRNGMFRYDNIDHCIETGLKAGLNLLGANFDLEAVNAELSYLEKVSKEPVEDLNQAIPELSRILDLSPLETVVPEGRAGERERSSLRERTDEKGTMAQLSES